MATDADHDPPKYGAEFFKNRFLSEILDWDYPLHVGLAPDSMPSEGLVQGRLIYTRSLDITGRVLGPPTYRGKILKVSIAPVGPDIDFGPSGFDHVGRINTGKVNRGSDFEVSLFLPEAALSTAISALGSTWTFLHLWTTGAPPELADVIDFAFSRTFHKNLDPWIGSASD